MPLSISLFISSVCSLTATRKHLVSIWRNGVEVIHFFRAEERIEKKESCAGVVARSNSKTTDITLNKKHIIYLS
jgi:hypothetical protein